MMFVLCFGVMRLDVSLRSLSELDFKSAKDDGDGGLGFGLVTAFVMASSIA
jgi:hypothetical protein